MPLLQYPSHSAAECCMTVTNRKWYLRKQVSLPSTVGTPLRSCQVEVIHASIAGSFMYEPLVGVGQPTLGGFVTTLATDDETVCACPGRLCYRWEPGI
jgi:hypothetical protein